MLAKIEWVAFRWTILILAALIIWGLLHPQKPIVVSAPNSTSVIVQTTPAPLPLVLPGVTVQTGLSPEILTSLVSALLHPPTRTQVAATTTISSLATPVPVKYVPVPGSLLSSADLQSIYGVAYSASYNASVAYGSTEHIQTNVTISQVPVPPSRFGAGVAITGTTGGNSTGGVMLDYNVPLTQHVDANVGASVGQKISPLVGASYRINGFRAGPCYNFSSKSIGLCLTYSI